MKEGGRGNSSRLVNVITRILVIGQIAMTAALLIAAALQIKIDPQPSKLDYGYDENGVLQRAHGADGRRLPERRRESPILSVARFVLFAAVPHSTARR